MKLFTEDEQKWYDEEGDLLIFGYDATGIETLHDVHCEDAEIEGSIYFLSPIEGTLFLEEATVEGEVRGEGAVIKGGVVANNVCVKEGLYLGDWLGKGNLQGNFKIKNAHINELLLIGCNFGVIDATGATVKGESCICGESASQSYNLRDAEFDSLEFSGMSDLDLRSATIKELGNSEDQFDPIIDLPSSDKIQINEESDIPKIIERVARGDYEVNS